MELRTKLQQRLGLALPSTLAFDYPTAAAVAAHCHSLLGAAASAGAASGAAAKAATSLENVAAAVAAALHAVTGSADLAPDAPLLSAGLDSLSAVELRDELQRRLGTALPSTLVFDYPTTAALQTFLFDHLCAASGGKSAGVAVAQPASQLATSLPWQPVLGLGQAEQALVTVDASASRLAAPSMSSSADSCRVTPFCRWDVDGTADGVPHRPGSCFGRWAPAAGLQACPSAGTGDGIRHL